MKTLLFFITLLFSITALYSQKEAYNWDFGGTYVITFDTHDGEPAILGQSIMPNLYNHSIEGVSSISDASGKMLFSTNGVMVYSYIGIPDSMKFHDGLNSPSYKILNGSFSTTQSAIIVKKPESDSIYYIFTAGSFLKSDLNYEKGYNYSIVNINRNQKKGEIIELNNLLFAPSTEKLTAIKHANGTDIWIITHQYNTNIFNVFLLTKDGIQDTISSKVGFIHSDMNVYGYMKSSLNCELLVNVAEYDNLFDLMKFDNQTGKINLIFSVSIDKIIKGPYGVEFSPNNTKLYISNFNKLIQLDISVLDTNLIKNSAEIITDGSNTLGALQVAPNGKIYMAKQQSGSNFKLSVINKPNLRGELCDYSPNGTKFNSSIGHYGLPNFVAGIFDFSVKVETNSVCEGEEIVLIAKAIPDFTVNQYTWTLPDGSEMTGKAIKIPNVNESHNGLYKVKVDINSTLRYDSVYIEVHPLPKAIITGNLSFCKNGSTTLTAFQDLTYTYKWSTGDTTPGIIVIKEGKYILTIENEFGCIAVDSVYVSYSEDLEFALLGESKLCIGDTLLLSTDLQGSDYIYNWSTGETTPSIMVTKGGKYILKVKSEAGCEGIDSITVDVLEMPASSILADKIEACFGESITLKAENYKPEFDYLWSTGEKTESISVSTSGVYRLIVTNKNQCSDTTEIEVKIHPDLALELVAENTNLCFDDSTRIYPKAKYAQYLWSTGETTESITVHDAGVYQLIIKNEFGCSDSAEIEISKFDANVTFDKEKLMFDELCQNDSQIENLKLTIETNSGLKISNIYTKSNNFEIININSHIKAYKNGETAELEIKFEPLDAGEFFDTLFVESDEPCIYKAALPIYGSSKTLFRFALPVIETEVGRKIEIPVNSALICPNANKLTADYEIEISVDKAYFLPVSVQFGEIIENIIVGNYRILKIKASAEFEKLSSELKPVNIIYGQALIARSETVPLTIQNVDFTNDRYFPEYQNGSLKIDGCVNDLSGIQIFKPTTMKVAPNPADGDLKVTVATQEEGSFSIIIYDFQGREVAKSEFKRSNKIYEENDYKFNISVLGTGVYSVHLTAPWTLKRERLLIVK